MEVDGLDISGEKSRSEEIRTLATENLKRIADFNTSISPNRILALMDQKTIWHPIGL
jgi:hypothetical protein